MEKELYRISLTYTRDDYARYLGFYKTVIRKTSIQLVLVFIVSLIIGLAVCRVIGGWIYMGVFLLLGVAMDGYMIWSQRRTDEQMIRRELKLMPVVYRFTPDRLIISNAGGNEYSVYYHEMYTVYEVDWAFYIMVDKNTAAIIPKRKCPEGLPEFIRGLGEIKAGKFAEVDA